MAQSKNEMAKVNRVLWLLFTCGGMLSFMALLLVVPGAIQSGDLSGLAFLPVLALFLPYFPLGLVYWTGLAPGGFSSKSNPGGWLILFGWLGYLILTGLTVAQRRRLRFFAFYTCPCLLLILNAVGCQKAMRTDWLKVEIGC